MNDVDEVIEALEKIELELRMPVFVKAMATPELGKFFTEEEIAKFERWSRVVVAITALHGEN